MRTLIIALIASASYGAPVDKHQEPNVPAPVLQDIQERVERAKTGENPAGKQCKPKPKGAKGAKESKGSKGENTLPTDGRCCGKQIPEL